MNTWPRRPTSDKSSRHEHSALFHADALRTCSSKPYSTIHPEGKANSAASGSSRGQGIQRRRDGVNEAYCDVHGSLLDKRRHRVSIASDVFALARGRRRHGGCRQNVGCGATMRRQNFGPQCHAVVGAAAVPSQTPIYYTCRERICQHLTPPWGVTVQLTNTARRVAYAWGRRQLELVRRDVEVYRTSRRANSGRSDSVGVCDFGGARRECSCRSPGPPHGRKRWTTAGARFPRGFYWLFAICDEGTLLVALELLPLTRAFVGRGGFLERASTSVHGRCCRRGGGRGGSRGVVA